MTPSIAPRRGRLSATLTVLTFVLGLLATLLSAPPAVAVAGAGLGTGHLWRTDGVSWLGTYRLSDGSQAFCLEVGKKSPVGVDYETSTGDAVIGVSSDDHARLAYIARTWGNTDDADTAAAGQLAVWTITGLAGKTQRYYAGRANERWPVVLERANQMLAEASVAASKSVSGSTTVTLADDGTGTVTTELTVDRVTGGPRTLDPEHTGRLQLTGAVFDDGSTTRSLRNHESHAIRATGDRAEMQVSADAHFSGLPYGRVATVGNNSRGAQMILFSGGVEVSASGAASARAVSPLPFQPRVSTVTSDARADEGTVITDQLTLDAEPAEGLLGEWGRFLDGGELSPIPVTVHSRLLGPFFEPVTEQALWPDGAPVVCDVQVVADAGPGTYTTPGCALPSAGYFTWVERIDPEDTPVDRGRDRVRPWTSSFGSATETTFASFAPTISTRVTDDVVDPGSCVADELDVGRLNPAADHGVDVESVLVGPFDERPVPGDDLGDIEALDPALVVTRLTTRLSGDGQYETPCVTVTSPGFYVFVFQSMGSPPDDDGLQVVPAFQDTTVHESETFVVTTPVVPDAPRPIAPALAFTGADGTGLLGGTGVGILAAGTLLVIVGGIVRAVRRRRADDTDADADASRGAAARR
ncbi:thioester domain-containing protein [Frigoribacterium sp. 2-23]|uniref:thioester domain-containing protein n=1 Tax=Frigoribacterium sp. 2-23 TaxID=3415006 RepID=UPI003C6FCADF